MPTLLRHRWGGPELRGWSILRLLVVGADVRELSLIAAPAAGKPAEAEWAFQQSLIRTPNNGWALYGLREAQKAQGDAVAARLTERLFKRAWAGGQADLDLTRL